MVLLLELLLLPLEVFTQWKFVAEFIRLNFNFIHKNPKTTIRFLSHPSGELAVTNALARRKACGRLPNCHKSSTKQTLEQKTHKQILQ